MYPQTVNSPTTAVTYKFKVSDTKLPTQYRFENRTPYVAYIAIGQYDKPVDVVANAKITCMGLNSIGFTVSPAQQDRTQTISVWLSNVAISAVFPDSIQTFISLITLTDKENVFESPSAGLLSSINPATFDAPAGYPVTYVAGTTDSDTPTLDLQGWNGAYIGLQLASTSSTLYQAIAGIEVQVSEDGVTWVTVRNYVGNSTTLVVPRLARYLRIRRKGNTHSLTIRARRYQNDPGISETQNPVFSGELPTTLGNPTVIFPFPKGDFRLYMLYASGTTVTFSSGFTAGGSLVLTAGVWGFIGVVSSYDGLHRIDLSTVITGAMQIVAIPLPPSDYRPLTAAPAIQNRILTNSMGAYGVGSSISFDTRGMQKYSLQFHVATTLLSTFDVRGDSNGPAVAAETNGLVSNYNYPLPNFGAGGFYQYQQTFYRGFRGATELMRLYCTGGSGTSVFGSVIDLSDYTPIWTTQG